MENKNEVEVVIGGTIYKLTATESPEYIQKLANYINTKISEIYKQKKNPTVNQHSNTLFIAINVADDFLKCDDENKRLQSILLELDERMKESEEKSSIYFNENTRLESENHLLKQKIRLIQKDFEEKDILLNDLQKEFENKDIEIMNLKNDIANKNLSFEILEQELEKKSIELIELKKEFDEYINEFGKK